MLRLYKILRSYDSVWSAWVHIKDLGLLNLLVIWVPTFDIWGTFEEVWETSTQRWWINHYWVLHSLFQHFALFRGRFSCLLFISTISMPDLNQSVAAAALASQAKMSKVRTNFITCGANSTHLLILHIHKGTSNFVWKKSLSSLITFE